MPSSSTPSAAALDDDDPPLVAVTPLCVAILALLEERDMHPYEMMQTLRERREDELVKVRPGSLYHGVERLLRDQLVEEVGTDRDGNRPERTTYRLTDAGRNRLEGWIDHHLVDIENSYPPLPLALSEAHALTPSRVCDRLSVRVGMLEQQIDQFQGELDDVIGGGVSEAYLIARTYRLAMFRAERDFVADLIQRIESKEMTWPTR